LLKDRSESLLGEVRSFVDRSLQHQKWRRIRLMGWLIIPVLILGIPTEYFWRKEIVRQNYHSIEKYPGKSEQRLAVMNLVEGCWAKKEHNEIYNYFAERAFGNCRSLENANLSDANLSDTSDLSSDTSDLLNHANLSYANLMGANLNRANLSYANLSRARLSEANLSYANLSYADLMSANLNRANLSNANLSGADLSGVALFDAHLSGADLSGAHLFGAHLFGAYLSGVDLFGADLSGADLSRAKFICIGKSPCVDMKNIDWDKDTQWAGIEGWKHVKNIPSELKKQLNLP
jgi:hypothetical protein